MTSNEIDNAVTWAVNTADKYNRGVMEVVARFKELEKQGVGIEQAKREIEQTYALGVIA